MTLKLCSKMRAALFQNLTHISHGVRGMGSSHSESLCDIRTRAWHYHAFFLFPCDVREHAQATVAKPIHIFKTTTTTPRWMEGSFKREDCSLNVGGLLALNPFAKALQHFHIFSPFKKKRVRSEQKKSMPIVAQEFFFLQKKRGRWNLTKWAHKSDDCVKEMEKMRKLRCFLSLKMWFVLKSLPHEVTLTGKGSGKDKKCAARTESTNWSLWEGKRKLHPKRSILLLFLVLAVGARGHAQTRNELSERTTLNKRGESASNEGETFGEFRAKLSLLGGAKKRREKSSL